MKKLSTLLLYAGTLLFFASCSSTPEQYFGTAALNCNLLYGFAGYELKRDLAMPSEKLVDEKTMATAPLKREEVVKDKLARVEDNYQKVKNLGNDADAAAMIKASIALYEFVLPVYKNEYMQLAALYDTGAPAAEIEAMEKAITQKYESTFLALYNSAWEAGKAYAQKNNIQVREVNPAPPGNK